MSLTLLQSVKAFENTLDVSIFVLLGVTNSFQEVLVNLNAGLVPVDSILLTVQDVFPSLSAQNFCIFGHNFFFQCFALVEALAHGLLVQIQVVCELDDLFLQL